MKDHNSRLIWQFVAFSLVVICGCERDGANSTPIETRATMASSYRLPRGIAVANLTGIEEAYSVSKSEKGYHVFTINVSAERILDVFCRLALEVNEPGFLLLETGTHRDVEEQLRKTDSDPYHKDVYYLDGQQWSQAKTVVDRYSELFVHDGIVNFGFGSHEGFDEVFVGGYKIFTIYANNPAKYEAALAELEFEKVGRVKTVWDNISKESPGERSKLSDIDPDIWKAIDQLKAQGLYLAERRED